MRKEILNALKELKTICLKKKEDSNFLSKETYLCTLNNGKKITRERILKNGTDGSAVIIYPITEEGKIIISIEPRVFTERTVDIGFPAGYIEPNEKPIDAARRELMEETGYDSNELIHIGSFYQDPGCSSAYNHYYLAKNCKKVTNQHLDKDEFVTYVLVDKNELDELVYKGYITSLNGIYMIEASKKYIRRRD